MLESFPTLSDNSTLTVEDFSWFSRSYAEILQKHLPAAKQVFFAFSAGQAENHFQEGEPIADLLSLFTQIKNGVVLCGIHTNYLMLSFNVKGEERTVAIISGADPLFLKRVSEDWLLGIREAVAHEYLLLKQARVDSQTGLLNMSNLYSLLDRYGSNEGLRLILLELAPQRTSFQHVLRYSHRCATLLLDFVREGSMLHSLGQSTFALVVQQNSLEEQPEIERGLVTYLKRCGCHRVHIGSSLSKPVLEGENQGNNGRLLLDKAWTALRHATKRGPFSFCDFDRLANPEKHPLAPPGRNLLRRLNRLWFKSNSFCLVHFCGDIDTFPANSVVPQHVDQGVVVTDGCEVFVYLDGVKGADAVAWAKETIRRINSTDNNIHISAGVSAFPYCDFKKTEMVFNCRKALLHAAFYGKSSAVLFDAVSLNISGDIYFADGDLAKAVKEYKRGLRCDNQDINLHNSLGVALAMMNKLSPALQSFANALAIDSNNFMALYNLGLGEQTRNKKTEALAYLKKALQYYSQEDGGEELVNDLTLQLGILSCDVGQYEAALSYLVPWQLENEKNQSAGPVHYYLGKAYYAQKESRKAMAALQRALRFDELDDRAMNLLGRVYLEEGEGDKIALSLCRKSVEMEPSNVRYLLDLGEVMLHCGLLHEARGNLYRCLRNRECKMEAQLCLGESFAQEGQYLRAQKWFEKIVVQKSDRQDLKEKAEKRLSDILAKK